MTLVAAALSTGIAPPPAKAIRPTGVVIITLDTTRADRLPAYGARGLSTPAIDWLAREGRIFTRAISVAPLTLPAHASLFTGLYPPRHGVRDNADEPLNEAAITLAEGLRDAGFRTGAFVGSAVLAADRGLAQGFEVYSDGARENRPAPHRRSAIEVVDEAVSWLQTPTGSPFFLWVHLYDAHAPQAARLDSRDGHGDRYAASLEFMDAQIGRILSVLGRTRALDRTAIIVAADHGESFGDHGELEHGIFLYEGPIRVPLIVRAPGLRSGRIDGVASLVDIAPTVLDLVDVPRPPTDGSTLLDALRDISELRDRVVYAESMYPRRFGWSPLRMQRTARFKYIDAPRPELFDLDADPFEEHNLAAQRPALAAEMRAGLTATTHAAENAAPEAASASQRQLLASLGYVSQWPASQGDQRLDPKDVIGKYNELRQRSWR